MFPVIHDAALFANGLGDHRRNALGKLRRVEHPTTPKLPYSKLRRGFSNQCSFFFLGGGGAGGFKHHWGQTQ